MNMNIKIKVKSEEHSEAIQKRFFELGAAWSINESTVCNLNRPYLYVLEGEIGFGNNEDFFQEHSNKEVTLDALYDFKEHTMEELIKILGYEFKIIRQ